ncbi:hypothetical protein K2X89_05650 [Myxococcota bacterium]|nr:hypothetical protein [Myxococcota bacterium]
MTRSFETEPSRAEEPIPSRWEARRARTAAEGIQEVLVTLLATLAFGLSWAAIEAGLANSALAREGIPMASAAEFGGGPESEGPTKLAFARIGPAEYARTGYARAGLETR